MDSVKYIIIRIVWHSDLRGCDYLVSVPIEREQKDLRGTCPKNYKATFRKSFQKVRLVSVTWSARIKTGRTRDADPLDHVIRARFESTNRVIELAIT